MTNTTLERAARAVSEAMASVPAKAMNNAEWIDFERKIARAVLMAVRTIDQDVMLKAQWGRVPERIQDAWSDVIDIILGENDDNA